MTLESIVEKFHARRIGNRWVAHCPGPLHKRGDRKPSLSIAEGRNGGAVLHCFAGCDTESIVSAVGLGLHDLFQGECKPRARKTPLDHAIDCQIADLWRRLTKTEQQERRPLVIITAVRDVDAAIARALALSVEGELVQVVSRDRPA
jgi:hypothetical protein